MAFISKIKAGDFNVKMALEAPGFTTDAFGGITKSYSQATSVWANKNVKTLRDIQEKFEGDQLQSYGRFVFTIRYSETTKGLGADWRLKEEGTQDYYEILGFVIDPRKEYIEIFTKQDLKETNPNG